MLLHTSLMAAKRSQWKTMNNIISGAEICSVGVFTYRFADYHWTVFQKRFVFSNDIEGVLRPVVAH